MNRRQICKGCLAAITIPISGCLGRLNGTRSTEIPLPDIVTDAKFEFSDGRTEDSQNEPSIQINTDERSAIITGTLQVGSGSCNQAMLEEITYESESETVTVVVSWEDTSKDGEVCTDDLSSNDYEVHLDFDSLPSTLIAEEHGYQAEEYTITEEIEGGLTSETNSGSSTITASEPELVPGDETTLTIEAADAAGIALTLPDTEAVIIDANDHDWSPSPDTILDSYPQIWYWSSQSSVEGEFPVASAEDAKPGEYSYEVTVYTDTDSDAESVTKEFTITITEKFW